jgi:predicted GNAT family N-acyltransferase
MKDIKIIKFTFEDQMNFQRSYHLREIVFIEEQNVNPEIEYEYEEESHFYLVEKNGKPIATGRWRETPKGIKLERFAVVRKERGKNIGKIIMNEMLADVLPLQQMVYLNAQLQAVPFYQKAGFKSIGEVFLEANIEHIRMVYRPPSKD